MPMIHIPAEYFLHFRNGKKIRARNITSDFLESDDLLCLGPWSPIRHVEKEISKLYTTNTTYELWWFHNDLWLWVWFDWPGRRDCPPPIPHTKMHLFQKESGTAPLRCLSWKQMREGACAISVFSFLSRSLSVPFFMAISTHSLTSGDEAVILISHINQSWLLQRQESWSKNDMRHAPRNNDIWSSILGANRY